MIGNYCDRVNHYTSDIESCWTSCPTKRTGSRADQGGSEGIDWGSVDSFASGEARAYNTGARPENYTVNRSKPKICAATSSSCSVTFATMKASLDQALESEHVFLPLSQKPLPFVRSDPSIGSARACLTLNPSWPASLARAVRLQRRMPRWINTHRSIQQETVPPQRFAAARVR